MLFLIRQMALRRVHDSGTSSGGNRVNKLNLYCIFVGFIMFGGIGTFT